LAYTPAELAVVNPELAYELAELAVINEELAYELAELAVEFAVFANVKPELA
jgi:hypothetical protein